MPRRDHVPEVPERESLFERVADRVSYGMGTPANIIVWIVLVGGWIAAGPYFADHAFLPAWFTSNGFNFPLNTVTTIAELYIGFLVGAASNRSERSLHRTLRSLAAQGEKIEAQEEKIEAVEESLRAEIQTNTDLTQQVHALVTLVHGLVAQLAETGMATPTAREAP